VAYVRTIGLQAGDQQILTVQSPTALPFPNIDSSARSRRGSILHFAGRKRREVAWPTGIYVASYRVVRDARKY